MFDSGFNEGSVDFMFSVLPAFIMIFSIVVFGIIIFNVTKGIMQWNTNNKSPLATAEVKVSSKRGEVTHHHHHHGNEAGVHHTSSTYYYVTFELISGERIELEVNGKEYGMISEGDRGILTYQGTRYKGFQRNI
ncbi:DUF2500 domain-containing protein [Alloiococcus sp. CFN-8]|uniref:DUF2500 domain-containing protein n=1 Tax=Alloiococcus sp. CFN-8 TaxID=3416081 RepID=UPI003CEDDD15